MTLNRYKIAGFPWTIQGMEEACCEKFKPFLNNHTETDGIYITLQPDSDIQPGREEVLLEEGLEWRRNADGGFVVYLTDGESKKVISRLEANTRWDRAVIRYNPELCSSYYAAAGPLTEVLFRNQLLFRHGLVMHAAAVDWKGRGILFTAPSGTGKSTQANLWKDYRGAEIINGDRPALCFNRDRPIVHGTPWSGTKQEFLNTSVPAAAIIVVEQAGENSIFRLTPPHSLVHLMPRCFLPYYDKEMMNRALSILAELTETIPVFLLRCRPDIEAVELAEKNIMNILMN